MMTRYIIRLTLSMVFLLGVLLISPIEAGAAEAKPERNRLEVAIAAYGPLYLPLLVAQEAAIFQSVGLTSTSPC